MQYGFILRDEGFDGIARTELSCHGLVTKVVGVKDFSQALLAAKKLLDEGIDFIELCGDFGEAGCREVIAAVGGQVPVGYVTYLPEEAEKMKRLFPE